ncbi:MAG: 6-O-methylguanine methyltransferase [Gammaproteobacteria bacterium]|nr:6-O-methylguanine methyltransferase [Gammaproteobacteria bacterium]
MNSMKAPHDNFVDSRDFARIARAIRFIDTHFRAQPRLAAIAAQAGLSEFHFNRLFRRWAGLTPKQYLAFVTGRQARGEIKSQPSVLEAAYAVGLSGPGRLHDLIVSLDAVTPGELKAHGLGIAIRSGFADTPFGRALLAATPRGLCHLAFVEPGEDEKAFDGLRASWRNADFERDDTQARELAHRIWSSTELAGAPLKLNVVGTNFQLKVWQALLDLGAHRRTTYSALANAIGQEGSARAVGNAVGANPVGWLIPCHNVLRRDGALGGYHWGEDRKHAILAWDSLSRQRAGSAIDVAPARHAT